MSREKKRIVEEQFNAIYDEYKEGIYRFCMAKLNCNIPVCEDCTQETFIVIYNRLKSGEDFKNPRAFLYKTAFNIIKKHYNASSIKQRNELSINDENPIEIVNDDAIYENIDYEELTNVIKEILSEEEIELFELRFIDGLKIEDIANQLNLKLPNCTTKLHRIRNKVKTHILNDYIRKE